MNHHVGNKISLHPRHGTCAAWVLLRYKATCTEAAAISLETTGSELASLIGNEGTSVQRWQLALSPRILLFAMTEKRDERGGNKSSPKHDTFYGP
jgi:hypothetical protein